MWQKIKRFIRTFFRKSRKIDEEPINKVSLVLIIIMDIFILSNVFIGLNDIGNWYISPSDSHPCYSQWNNYRDNSDEDKQYTILTNNNYNYSYNPNLNLRDNYQNIENKHLGSVSPICYDYASSFDATQTREFRTKVNEIDSKQGTISTIEAENRTIREQYDSTLLEEIAGQPGELSINQVEAREARQTLEENNNRISNLKNEIDTLKREIFALPTVEEFFTLLNSDDNFNNLEASFERASFWYPSIQIIFQVLFLAPLIAIATWLHLKADNNGNGQLALITWHLLIIFYIPLIIKIFQFLQVGALLSILTEIVTVLFTGLLFVLAYLYIFIIPLITFALIKFSQKVIFNTKNQATKRIQKSKCLRCAKKLPPDSLYCPHCGYYQYQECHNCQNLTYKHLPYCINCGASQQQTQTNN
ncbi:hypothetical protein IQ215_11550 [Cyanobacterium stanieri LEGE 03274]|uniref:Zinc ribbon domain-containing protein n=1 Tax=Cyanobacterium stanieri LEGE 03274 TaxID=1828756 RepID=A0ABR9V628_9CHRO|nr:zinc ribbon domain-containing protein [Cyanobacterium stanieri]MBE9223333.1 hypothetical protein [Cyanobacterium stanieri LEGE 03274]